VFRNVSGCVAWGWVFLWLGGLSVILCFLGYDCMMILFYGGISSRFLGLCMSDIL